MGVNHLWRDLLKGSKSGNTPPLTQLNGLRLGIDISVWFHEAMQTLETFLPVPMHSEPPYPPKETVQVVLGRCKILESCGIIPVFVFDGARHQVKNNANDARSNTYDTAMAWLDEFYQRGKSGEPITTDDLDEAKKKCKSAMKRTPEVTKMIVDKLTETNREFTCAPFEAEWQLVYMEKQRQIDAIHSIDGDLIILGAKRLVYNIDCTKQRYLEYNRPPAPDT